MDIIKEGYLLKKGHIITTWKKRWHVLTLNSLDYYENESKLVKKGTIQINNYTKIDIKNNDNYKFVVYNTNNSNILEIDAKDENERNEWIFIIENVIKKYIVKLFYRDCLTVNRHANPVEVLDNILDNEFISYGAQNKSKYVLTDQVQFFWKIIPDLKWEVQEMLIEGNTVIVRSLASGSPRGDFMGITGLDGSKSFRVTTIDIHIVENGRIKYVYHLEDWGTAITQLRGNGYVASSDDNVNLGIYRRVELTAESRQAAIDVVTPFYNDCLTVNSHANPVEVLDRILADEFISVGVPNKSKQALTNQVQFFWKLIPDLKWEIQNIFVDGNKVVVRSLASGSPRGDFMGITGLDGSKSFHVTTIDIHTVENGRVKVVNHLEDWSAAKAQLSAVTPESAERRLMREVVTPFYKDCLTVNSYANPAEVLDRILDDEFISYGAQNKSKQALTNQVQFFWSLIPDLKWEVQEMLIEGNTVIVRSLASGSPRGDFMGITGLDGSKSFRVTTIDIHIVENGRIKYVYHLEDWGTAITQLRGNGYVASSDDNVNLGIYRRVELTAESRQAAIDVVTPFYNDCLTVNSHANPVEVLDRILADEFISVGVPNKSKQALTNQVQFFWKLIPDLKWEIQNIFVDGNKVIVRSLASGSPRGDFMGITGLDGSKSFHVTTIDIHTVENGRVKVVNHLEDWSAAKAQLE